MVARIEAAPVEKRYSERLEKLGPHDVKGGLGLPSGVGLRLTLHGIRASGHEELGFGVEGEPERDARALHSFRLPQLLLEILEEPRAAMALAVLGEWKLDARVVHAFPAEPSIHVLERAEALEEKHGGDQKSRRERHLEDDEGSSRARGSASPFHPSSGSKRVREILSASEDRVRRCEREEDREENRDQGENGAAAARERRRNGEAWLRRRASGRRDPAPENASTHGEVRDGEARARTEGFRFMHPREWAKALPGVDRGRRACASARAVLAA